MIFLNKENLGPPMEKLTTWGLFGAGLVVAAGRQGIAEVRHRRRAAQAGNGLASHAVQQTYIEPEAPPLPRPAEAAAVVEFPEPEPKPDLALSA